MVEIVLRGWKSSELFSIDGDGWLWRPFSEGAGPERKLKIWNRSSGGRDSIVSEAIPRAVPFTCTYVCALVTKKSKMLWISRY
jgi:hypothetical protein